MIVKYLSASNNVHQIIHFDAPISITSLFRLFSFKKANQSRLVFYNSLLRAFRFKHTSRVKNFTFVHRPGKGVWKHLFFFIPSYENYSSFVEKILEEHQTTQRRTVFYVCPVNFEFPEIARKLDPQFIVSDVIDDQRAFLERRNASAWQAYTKNYKEILDMSHLVIANCEGVRNAFTNLHHGIQIIPNACEAPVDTVPSDPPGRLRKLQGPILGYVGNLSSRIDIDLLERIASEKQGWNIVLIGSAHLSRQILSLKRFGNVRFFGVIPYNKVTRYIDHFDVAIIPHTNDELTKSMNPLKLFVYCSRGVPVVTSNIANIGELRDLVLVAEDHEDFINKVELALAISNKSPSLNSKARALLERNTWSQRTKHLMCLIERTWPERQ